METSTAFLKSPHLLPPSEIFILPKDRTVLLLCPSFLPRKVNQAWEVCLESVRNSKIIQIPKKFFHKYRCKFTSLDVLIPLQVWGEALKSVCLTTTPGTWNDQLRFGDHQSEHSYQAFKMSWLAFSKGMPFIEPPREGNAYLKGINQSKKWRGYMGQLDNPCPTYRIKPRRNHLLHLSFEVH